MITKEEIRELIKQNKFRWSRHCLIRILERQITKEEVINGLINGKIIEQYEQDYPWPSCLIYSKQETKCIHIVIAKEKDIKIYIITVYEPSIDKFEDDFVKRRKG